MSKEVYEPREDSFLLEKYTKKYSKGNVLDIGTGSGIQALAASKKKNVDFVLAMDIQQEVIEHCKRLVKNDKIKFRQSDLFSNVKGKFDTIIFNPPYLPGGIRVKDLTVEGGKKGYETIEKFLSQANNYLAKKGIILTIFSSLTKREKLKQIAENNLFEFKELEKKHIFFEDLYVWMLRKSKILRELECKGISNISFYAKGHRGIVLKGLYKGRNVAIKYKNPKSRAAGRIKNEAKWLKKLNKFCIGPELVFSYKNYIVYKFIDGIFVEDYISVSNKNDAKKLIKDVFYQMRMMDKLKVSKEEMHRPYKHIIVRDKKPVLIDFERSHSSNNPKNITQFCQYLLSRRISRILEGKLIKINKNKLINSAKSYKQNKTEKSFITILNSIGLD